MRRSEAFTKATSQASSAALLAQRLPNKIKAKK
jgi:hypothetical protein